MKTKSFTLERITRSGRADRWRVRGTLNGERISRSFADKGQAKAFRETKEIERHNGTREVTATLTRLTGAQAFDAEKALAMLDGRAAWAGTFKAHYEGLVTDAQAEEYWAILPRLDVAEETARVESLDSKSVFAQVHSRQSSGLKPLQFS